MVAPVVAAERGMGRSEPPGEVVDEGLEGAGGEDGDGVSKGPSEPKSSSGVEAVEAMTGVVQMRSLRWSIGFDDNEGMQQKAEIGIDAGSRGEMLRHLLGARVNDDGWRSVVWSDVVS